MRESERVKERERESSCVGAFRRCALDVELVEVPAVAVQYGLRSPGSTG